MIRNQWWTILWLQWTGMTTLCAWTAWEGSTPFLSYLHVSSHSWRPQKLLELRWNSVRLRGKRQIHVSSDHVGRNVQTAFAASTKVLLCYNNMDVITSCVNIKSSCLTWGEIFIELFIVFLFISIFIVQLYYNV